MGPIAAPPFLMLWAACKDSAILVYSTWNMGEVMRGCLAQETGPLAVFSICHGIAGLLNTSEKQVINWFVPQFPIHKVELMTPPYSQGVLRCNFCLCHSKPLKLKRFSWCQGMKYCIYYRWQLHLYTIRC